MKSKKPLFLITNDDGINAKGFRALIDVALEFGRVVAITSKDSYSAMSHSITVKTPLNYKEIDSFDDNLKLYECNGSPADSIKLGVSVILKEKPDYVFAGINHGTNSSISVHYSGTVGGAREGCFNGIKSIAFSLLNYNPDADFTAAKKVVRALIDEIIDFGIKDNTYLNVNIPDVRHVKGIKQCRQSQGKWIEKFEEKKGDNGQINYWLTGYFENLEPESTDTDEYWLNNGYASLVPCSIDATNYNVPLKNYDYENM